MTRIWATCAVCDQLVRVIPGTYKGEGRAQWWFPVRHKAPDGGDCDGHERGI